MSRLDLSRIKAKCSEDGDCLLWAGKTYKNGHPAATEWIDKKDRHVGVRRRAYEEYNKVKLQVGELVTTSCAHPACLAKKHLALTDVSERSRRAHEQMDAATRLRRSMALAKGVQLARGKVSPEQVAQIRESADGPYVVAKRLGINGVVASRIKRGESYREYFASPFSGLGA